MRIWESFLSSSFVCAGHKQAARHVNETIHYAIVIIPAQGAPGALINHNRLYIKVPLTHFVEIERELARQGTIEPGLEERRPVVGEAVLGGSFVVLAHPRHPRVNGLNKEIKTMLVIYSFSFVFFCLYIYLAAVDKLGRRFPEKEENVVTIGQWIDKIRSCFRNKKRYYITVVVFAYNLPLRLL